MCCVSIGAEREALLDRITQDVTQQLESRPARLAHTMRVGACAADLAGIYGVDVFEARAAGLLHDWEKALSHAECIQKARHLGIDLGVDLELVEPLLHGIIAAHELPHLYPELPDSVFQAIKRHTIGACDMSDLDMVLFVADAIEPGRGEVASLVAIRETVGRLPLEELYFATFSNGLAYVIESGRYLYPATLEIYNTLALRRAQNKNHGAVLGRTQDKEHT